MPKKNSRKKSSQGHFFALTASIPCKAASPNDTPPHSKESMSEPEKKMLSMILPEAEPLPYPLHPLKMAYGPDALEYEIPQEDKGEVLKELYPFFPCPQMTEERFDIHEQKKFCIKDFRVIRERNRNMLVSPFYPVSGGMLIDWGPVDMEDPVQIFPLDEVFSPDSTP